MGSSPSSALGFGMASFCIFQREPSHRSARNFPTVYPQLSLSQLTNVDADPAAVHAFAAVQDTEVSVLVVP
jgi:hypothetical protein